MHIQISFLFLQENMGRAYSLEEPQSESGPSLFTYDAQCKKRALM